jgi:hypothetical protein
MTTNTIRFLAFGVLLASGCGALAPEDGQPTALTASDASGASPLAGVWYSATAATQLRATVSVDGAANFSMELSPASDSSSLLFVIAGTVDPDGRHLNDAILVNGVARHCYGFASADGSRMFVGVQDDTRNYLDSWTFVRVQ